MNDTAPKTSRPRRSRRAWWQWVVGGGLLVTAAFFAIVRWAPIPGLRSSLLRPVEPRAIRVAADLQASEVVPAASGELAGCNLLLVTFDTTRADRIGCYGHDEGRTFTLDQLAREGVLFSQAIAPAPSTLPSHASLLTGLYPYHHGARANGLFRLDNEYQTLAEVLAAEGYATGALVSAAVLEAQYGLDQGFGDYDDEMTSQELEIAERTADETAPLAEDWLLKHAADKFFLWVHFYDPHWPYEAPESGNLHPYDAEIALADAQLGRLIGLIDDLGLTNNTLVVVAGDHGEGLGQHDEWMHSSLIYESTLHVPLIMRCGQRLGGGVHVGRLVSLVDVMPTVLAMLGIDAPAGLDGVDLTRPEEGSRLVFSETLQGLVDHGWAALLGVRDASTKYIYGPRDELYDLSQDPFEETNLIASREEAAAGMKRQLMAFFGADLEQAGFAEPTHELDPAALARLQSLGYLGGGVNARTAAERPHPIDMMPIQQRVLTALGLEKTEGLAESTRALEKVVRDYPDLYTGHLSLGRAYRKAGDLERAEAEFARSLELDPERWEPLMALASLRVRQNETAEAIELYRAAGERYPENFLVLKELGRLLIQTGEFDEGTETLTKALAIWPRDEALPDMVADAMLLLNRPDEALELFQGLLAEHPDAPMIRNALSRLFSIKNRYAEAMVVLREGIQRAPEKLSLVNNLAFLLVTVPDESMRRHQEAIAMMERVCFETGYQDPRYLHTLSMVYSGKLRLDEAILVAEKARKIAVASGKPHDAQLVQGIALSLQSYRQAKEQGLDLIRYVPRPPDAEEAGEATPVDAETAGDDGAGAETQDQVNDDG